MRLGVWAQGPLLGTPRPVGPSVLPAGAPDPGHRVTSETSPIPCSLTLGYDALAWVP